ncbi:unnamed protein product [Acanthoscelides obtectus]|uniref:C2H2-type domain-containing protein n=1 Tax=Acanthoscelides obtectus TaxID=200917 RepID=A0A9P0PST5_ACAOB|nr:unnamed protein product [Acanthoscelides obtectus]CAK1626578.1 Zinc finger protein 142 [Acanthoscelides obtectus]
MDHGNKKVKLDPDSVKGTSLQEETPDQDDKFEETLVEPCDEDIELEASSCPMKFDIEQEPLDATEYTIEINTDLKQMEHHSAQQTKDETKHDDSIVKSENGNIKDFICVTCNYITTEPLDFTNHWLGHETQTYTHQNGRYVCHICQCLSVFPTKMELLKHIANRHLIRYRCAFCYYVTYSTEDFDEHSRNHFTYQCVRCDLESTKHFFVQNHLETPLECEFCDFKAYHWILYQKHVNMHRYPPDSIIECRFCGFTTGYNCLLKKHLVVHCGKFIICKMCDFTGLKKAELDKHYKIAHHTTLESIGKVHKCMFCTCKFTNLGSKLLHEKSHFKENATFKCCTSSTTIQCPYCNYQDENINEHIHLEHSAELELEGFRCESTVEETVIKLLNPESFETEDEPKAGREKDSAEYEDVITSADDADNQVIEDSIEIYAEKASHRCPNCFRTFTGMNAFEKHLFSIHKMTYAEAKTKLKNRQLCKLYASTTKKHFISDHPEPNKTKPILEPKLIPNPQRYICPFCYYVTFMVDEFKAHCQRHTVFKCTDCNFESTKRLFVEDHMHNPWSCSKCRFKAHHWLPLIHHVFSRHDKVVALLRCQECNLRDRHRALHGENGPFNVKCSQCHTSKTKISEDDNGKDTNSKDDRDGWTKCPYCGYKDEARYRMIDHLSQVHENELEIEGFRYKEATKKLREKPGRNTAVATSGDRRKHKTKYYETSEINTEMNKTNRKLPEISLTQKEQQKQRRSAKADEINLEADAHLEDIARAEVLQNEGVDSIDSAKEESDDIAQANALQEDADSIKRHSQTGASQEEGSDNTQQAHNVLQESGGTAQTNLLEEVYGIHQPIGKIIGFEEIYHGVLKEEDADSVEQIEKMVDATDFLNTKTVGDIPTTDAPCTNRLNLRKNEQKWGEKGPLYYEQENRWYCPLCPYSWMGNSYAVVHHFDQRHKRVQNPLFKCAACRYNTKSWLALSNHISLMHRAKADSEEIPCKQPGCKYKAPSVDELSRHMAHHLQTSIKEVMKYKCERCNFATVSDKVFKKHNCISTMNHECYDCGFQCETRIQIYYHIIKRHRYTNSKTKGFQCRKCGLASKDKTWRERHLDKCAKMR